MQQGKYDAINMGLKTNPGWSKFQNKVIFALGFSIVLHLIQHLHIDFFVL